MELLMSFNFHGDDLLMYKQLTLQTLNMNISY